ncbi:ribosome maturation factor RimP [Brevibacterium album]|uniref:ribosome maturation factor RimP n=1 Tax=Brevibacterium album TaxID=417948 RepID=UPI0003F6EADA|nr:ribosome maturation factor [Brevibacterium album]
MSHEADAIREKITAPLRELGLTAEEVRAHAAGRHRKVTVTVDLDSDAPDPVSFDHIEQATRLVSELLDELVLWREQPYTLEVTSPGAERELTTLRHFRRALGRRVRVAAEPDGGRPAECEGILTAVREAPSAEEPGAELEVEVAGEPVRILFAAVSRAQVVVSFR